ncbi:Somatostatin receptor type 5 [Orchesella cincta]|uniref:Somatostatin receptor type 5 n=1 Tax=Orchesella cincta TaxID=48709 RepID=A0A1D2M837_ORCCI|nr:Somatostatin receptor type 5 [Orchesella cincta]
MNLSVANVCMLISIIIFIATEHLGNWPFGNLLLIAGKWSKPLIAKYLAGVLWIVSFPLMVPVIMYADTLDIGENIQYCTVDWPDSSTMKGNTQYILYLVMNGFGVPFPFILALCILIVRRCVRDGGQSMNSLQKEKLETTTLVLAIQIMHFACVIPMSAVEFAFIFIRELEFTHSQTYFVILRLSYYLGYSSAVFFPILCALLSTNFKKSFKEACSCAKTQVEMCPEQNMAELQLIPVTETCE